MEGFRANELALNFNKTNYIHFATKRNMSANLKIGLNNNLIPNSSYIKFLGFLMHLTLSWKNNIDLLMKKFSTACYIIRNVKTYMSALALKIIYHAFFHLAVSYGIIFWGNWLHSSTIFRMQRKAIRIM